MNAFLNGMKNATNLTYTENGALTHKSTNSDLLDLFAMGGAYRKRSDEDCILLFKNAYIENPTYALKCLFYLRDIRGNGQGERRFFRVCMKWLASYDREAARRNLKYVAEYGRWDDLFVFMGTTLEKDVLSLMRAQLAEDVQTQTPSLLAKWLPSINTSSFETRQLANKVRNYFGMTPREYRKTLSILRQRINVLERLMSAGKWDEIEFDKIPSRAGMLYKKAFMRHDLERQEVKGVRTYEEFIKDDTTEVNTDVLNPVDIANEIFRGRVRTETDRAAIEKYWHNLKDYYHGREERGIAICDVSGSMSGQPLNAAVSMSAYIAERGKGPFKDHFITFSNNPELVRFEGADITDKFLRAARADWGGSTNVEAAMNLMLEVACRNNVPAEDMPTVLYIFSDMEFNACMSCGPTSAGRWDYSQRVTNPDTLFETIEKRWNARGYQLPRVIFWNLDARQENIPALGGRFSYVSGFSMSMVDTILSGKDGYDLMMEVLDSERYVDIF